MRAYPHRLDRMSAGETGHFRWTNGTCPWDVRNPNGRCPAKLTPRPFENATSKECKCFGHARTEENTVTIAILRAEGAILESLLFAGCVFLQGRGGSIIFIGCFLSQLLCNNATTAKLCRQPRAPWLSGALATCAEPIDLALYDLHLRCHANGVDSSFFLRRVS